MVNINDLLSGKEKVSVIGLGYVGMPLAVAFAKKVKVLGFDINKEKVQEYLDGIDATNEVGNEAIKNTTAEFTWDESRIKECKFHVVAVPTPTNEDKTPDLRPVLSASRTVGRNLTKGSIVVYESTVYPGVTEDECIPVLEEASGLKCGVDFKIGYSPERINPGDKVHRLETIVKVVSGMDEETLETVAKAYELIIEAGVHRASSIKVAEASKVIENSQRDVNIAFVNELSMMFDKMGINTHDVLDAASTKWNFIKLNPGLVGGHCIGVDPFYLIHKAKELGYESQVMAASRRINDGMAKFVADNTVLSLIKADKKVKGAKVGILGFTFKEDCPDTRNTKVIDIIKSLKEYGIDALVTDPVAENKEVKEEYGISLTPYSELSSLDAVIVAVSHTDYRNLTVDDIKKLFAKKCDNKEVAVCSNEKNVIIDVKGIVDRKAIGEDTIYWSL